MLLKKRNNNTGRQLIYLFISILSWVCRSSPCTAQPYYFRHYQVESGLSNNTVFCCIQDKQGFIWMGTKDGLNRFNGYSFDVFGSGKDSSGLGDGYIRSLYISPDDSMYVGTRIGVYKYHPLTERFSEVLRTTQEVTDIQQDDRHNLWMVCGNRLIRFNVLSHQKKIYTELSHPNVTSVCIDSEGTVYAGTADGYIEKLSEPGNCTVYNLFEKEPVNYSKWIERLYITKNNKIIAGTSNFGVKYFDPGTGASKNILTKNKEHNGIYVRDFVQVSDSVIWIGTESGIFIYNIHSNTYTNLANETGNNYSLSDNAVYTLCIDREGGIWAGTYSGGINYYHPQYSVFTKYFPQAGKPGMLSGNVVREICPDHLGNLWIGTEDAGLNKLNLGTNLITHYTSSGSRQDVSYPNIHGLLPIGEKLLIGTFEHGLDIMDIPSGKVVHHYPDGKSGNNLRSRFIVTLLRAHNGVIYAGTRMGLYTFNLQTGEFGNVDTSLSDRFIHTLWQDDKGNLWIGTMGSGLFIFSPQTNILRSLSDKFKQLNNAGTQWITTIFQDREHTFWIGTEGSGLIKYNLNKDSFEDYSSDYGFPGTTVYKILEDDRKTLWITTSGGLVHFDPGKKKIIKIYTTANGLLSDQFNYNSGYKDTSGRMYFGSVKGMISFNPQEIISSRYQPPIYITEITTGKEKISLSSQKRSLIYDSSKVILNHDQSTFSIQFAALSYIAPEMTKYRYMMEGLDNQWTTTSGQKISFTALPPGTYEFKVQAVMEDGNRSGYTAHVTIQIRPPFWQSQTAYLLYTLLGTALLFFIVRNYHIVTTEKNKRKFEQAAYEKEKEMYHNKLDFLTNVAHEIRTPLTLIKAPLEKILRQADALPDIRKYLFTMQRNTDRMIDLSDELLDFKKTEVGSYGLRLMPSDLNPFIREIAENFEEAAASKNIQTTLLLSGEPLISNIDDVAFKKIIANLIANAVKYASRKIIIESSASNDKTHNIITFKNDGEKIAPDQSEKIFEPFYRLEAARRKMGSGLGLTLSRSLAILHDGSLVLVPGDDIYNTFVLTLPAASFKGPAV